MGSPAARRPVRRHAPVKAASASARLRAAPPASPAIALSSSHPSRVASRLGCATWLLVSGGSGGALQGRCRGTRWGVGERTTRTQTQCDLHPRPVRLALQLRNAYSTAGREGAGQDPVAAPAPQRPSVHRCAALPGQGAGVALVPRPGRGPYHTPLPRGTLGARSRSSVAGGWRRAAAPPSAGAAGSAAVLPPAPPLAAVAAAAAGLPRCRPLPAHSAAVLPKASAQCRGGRGGVRGCALLPVAGWRRAPAASGCPLALPQGCSRTALCAPTNGRAGGAPPSLPARWLWARAAAGAAVLR